MTIAFTACLWASLTVSCSSCGDRRKPAAEQMTELQMEQAVNDAHNALTSLDYTGTYYSVLPFEQYGGLGVRITLTEEDYVAEQTYMNTGETKRFTGKYEWDSYGTVITLEGVGAQVPHMLFVGEEQLIVTDTEGKPVSDARYVLPKVE